MGSDRYYGGAGDIAEFTVEINSTGVTAGKVRNVSIRGEAEHDELFTPDSVSRDDVKRRDVAVVVECTVVEFNEELAQYWLEGSDSTSTTLEDDSNVAEFDVTFEHRMTDWTGEENDESLKAVVDNVHFPNMPLVEMAQGEYSEIDLSGRGDGVTLTKEVEPA